MYFFTRPHGDAIGVLQKGNTHKKKPRLLRYQYRFDTPENRIHTFRFYSPEDRTHAYCFESRANRTYTYRFGSRGNQTYAYQNIIYQNDRIQHSITGDWLICSKTKPAKTEWLNLTVCII